MKVYICDICGNQAVDKTAIGLYASGKSALIVRKLNSIVKEGDSDKHTCSLKCLTEFFAKWLDVDSQKPEAPNA